MAHELLGGAMESTERAFESMDQGRVDVHHSIAHLAEGAFVSGLSEDVGDHVVSCDERGVHHEQLVGALDQ